MSRNPPPDPYLQWLLNVLVKQMNKQGSPFYLPQLILNQSNPAYEPYTIDGEWSIPSSAQLQQAGDPICVATIPSDIENLYQAIASRPPNVTLAGPTTLKFQGALPFRVSGISNVIAQSAVAVDVHQVFAVIPQVHAPDHPDLLVHHQHGEDQHHGGHKLENHQAFARDQLPYAALHLGADHAHGLRAREVKCRINARQKTCKQSDDAQPGQI